jgi:regulator of protease activity HflC (stomatin/prohibitin superfamily)
MTKPETPAERANREYREKLEAEKRRNKETESELEIEPEESKTRETINGNEKEAPIEIPPEKLLSIGERWKRIIYFATMISIIPIITVLILKTIAEWIFGLMATTSGTEIPDGFSFGGAILAVWIILWIVIAAIEIKITVEKATGIVLVESTTQAIIEMFGGYSFTAKYKTSGKIKLIERIFCFYYPFEKCREPLPALKPLPDGNLKKPLIPQLMSLRIGIIDIEKQEVITKDKAVVNIDAFVYGHIFNGQRAVFAIEDLYKAIKILSTSTMRVTSGDIELDDLVATTGRLEIADSISATLQIPTDTWGFKVTEVRIEIVDPSPNVKEAMQKAAIEERNKQALIIKTEGEKQQKILLAEGVKVEKILLAEGEQVEIMKIREGLAATGLEKEGVKIDVSRVGPNYVIGYKWTDETMPKVADGNATKLVIPIETTNYASIITQAAEFIRDDTKKFVEKVKVEGEKTEENKGEEKKKEKEEE